MTNFLLSLAAEEYHPHQPHAIPWLPEGIQTTLGINNMILAQWLIVLLLVLLAFIVNVAVLNGKATKLRGTFELLFDFLEGWFASFIGGRKNARKYMPLLGSLFVFILISNYLGIVPTIGSAGSLFAPTGRWGTTLGLALVVAIAIQIISVKEMGVLGWIKHLLHLGPLSILEEFVRPFSLSLRLFGNIFAEETLLGVIVFLAPYIAPIPIMGLSLMFGAIQAIVFTTLSAIYIGGVLEHAEHVKHEHGHHEAHEAQDHHHQQAHAH